MAALHLRSIGCALVAALVVAAATAVPAAAADRVPASFFGVVAEPELLSDEALAPAGSSLEREMDAMVASGVGSMRMSFFWAHVQPYETWADVPAAERARFSDVGARPFDFTETDRTVAAAAARRIELLPVLLWAPDWAARHPGEFASPPADPAAFAGYAAALAGRYGPRGSFWREHPAIARVPIRDPSGSSLRRPA